MLAMRNRSFVDAVNASAKRVHTWTSQCVAGYLKGKESSCPATGDIRAIFPLEPMQQLWDSLLAARLQRFLDGVFLPVRGVHIGARKGTQAVEIPYALQTACEKCQDYGINAAFGQLDSLQHYDRLQVGLIARWLCDKGADKGLVAAMVGFQMLSNLSLTVAGHVIHVGERAVGALTGTRISGQLGRVPIEASVLKVHKSLAHLGLPLFMPTDSAEQCRPEYCKQQWEPFCQITFATFVDNVFVAGRDVKSFCKLADSFEKELRTTWNQTIKPSSKEFYVPRGVSYGSINLGAWTHASGFRALGVFLQDNNETDTTWLAT